MLMKLFTTLKKMYDRLEEGLIAALIAATTLIIFYQVVMRYVFHDSPAWSEEIARFMFVWDSWLGVSLAQKYGKHIKIEAVTARLTGKKLAVMNIIADVITGLICIVLVFYGSKVVDLILMLGQTSSATGFPMWIVYLACPLSCALMIFRLIGDIRTQVFLLKHEIKEAI